MKEPFVSTLEYQDLANSVNEMEIQSYLAALSANGQLQSFERGNVESAINRVKAKKNSEIESSLGNLTGADNMITSAAYYLARTQDLNSIASDVDTIAAKQASVREINANLVNRQYEINEWSNENKLDTLFFMQVLFITITFISCLLFLRSRDIIPPMLFFTLISLASVISVLVLLSRTRYTNVLRNSRYWHRARFPSMPNKFPTVVPPPAAANCPA